MRLLVVVHGGVGGRVTGPEIRGWEIARALSAHHDVTVAVHDPPGPEKDGLPLVPSTRRELGRVARRHDAVIAPILPPYLFAALRGSRTIMVSDQYDPVELELSIFTNQPGVARAIGSQRMVRRMQLRFADVVVCAAERQRELLLAELDALPERRAAPPAIVTMPFGLPAPPAPAPAGGLRSRFRQIGDRDPIVFWWGKVWKWFDAATAIRAFEIVVRERPDARLVISAGKAPKEAFDRSANTEEARTLARGLGLLDRNVFLLDEWVPYDRRHELLQDAELGITLHGETAEAPYAARARYMDYLWAGLPAVLARGDEVADRFGAAGFARLVSPGRADEAARAMLELIGDRRALARARTAGRELAAEYRWETLVRPLAEAIERRVAPRRPPRTLSGPLVRDVGTYYLRRAVDCAAGLAAR
jgi:glycosyltransferase involved in cell wall biosynthesis